MKKYLKWIITIAASLALFIAYISINNPFHSSSGDSGVEIINQKMEIFKILSNGSFVTGVIVLCLGLLIFVSNEGTFDIFAYGIKSFLGLFKKNVLEIKKETFYEYKLAKKDKKLSFVHMIIVGAIFILAGGIFLYFYHLYE